MRHTRILIVLCLGLLTQSSCTWLATTTRVRFNGAEAESDYYFNNQKINPKEKRTIARRKPFVINQMAEGRRTRSQVYIPRRFDGLALLTAGLFFSVPYLIPLEYLVPGSPFKHPPNIALGNITLPELPHNPMPKVYFDVSNHFEDLEYADYSIYQYSKYQKVNESALMNKRYYKSGLTSRQALEVDNADKILGNLLETMKGQPDLGDLVLPYDRSFNLELSIDGLVIAKVKHGKLERGFCDMKFIIRDKYEVVQDSLIYRVSSTWYENSVNNDRFMLQTMIEDGLSQLFIDPELEEIVERTPSKNEAQLKQLPLLNLTSTKKGQTLETAMQAQITLKNENYLSSGFMVSQEGHFITSYSNVTELDSLVVVFPDGTSKKPTLERMDPVTNVALMRVDTTGITTVNPSTKGIPDLGTKLYAVGTPVNEWLDHSVTRGVVSSVRKIDGYDVIQTDTRSSFGNNGSPVMDESGQLIGIMNNKLYFMTAQGLSLVVPIHTVLERLHLQIN